ncbi:MAG: ribonuclease R [Rhodospirillales bacterium]|nr:ribonuclease R [Rhodospirillales bacterium]
MPNKPASGLPSRDDILAFIRESERHVGKREIARAFGLKGDQRTALKTLLKDLESDGLIGRLGKRKLGDPSVLPRVAVVEIVGPDTDGELIARPHAWPEDQPVPRIFMAPEPRSRSALGRGDRVLARLQPIDGGAYEGRTIRRLPAVTRRALGIYRVFDGGGRIKSIDKRAKEDFLVAPGEDGGAEPGELVWAEVRHGRAFGPRHARIVERIGAAQGARSISLITIHDHDIPVSFAPEALAEAEVAGPAPLVNREDLRAVPLVTIDGADARDFDDAVWAEADGDAENPGGWHLIVAIADVAWYVRPGSALDKAAYPRGNSVYFPDRVVPMLPEALSNGWCSLVPGEDRPCLAAHLWLDRDGNVLRHRFTRAMMRSAARLTYSQVQKAQDGHPDAMTDPLRAGVITPLFRAYAALDKARRRRGVLELDLPERRVVIGGDGMVVQIVTRERLDSHKLIEEFMIAANVAAAETLEQRKLPCLYRIHDQPTPEKLEALRDFLETVGLRLPRGQVIRARMFNDVLNKAAATPLPHLVHEVVLRSQSQAEYSPVNIGHFGLALRRYCHFTSPIRRYSDLLVHRALIRTMAPGEGGLEAEPGDFVRVGEHLSATERRAQAAERDAVDRFTAAYLADKVGSVFGGRINGVTRFGLFVTLDDSGGDGLVPIRSLGDDFFVHDESRHRLVGRSTGLTFRLGDSVSVRLIEADPITGGLILQVLDGGDPAGARQPRQAAPAPTGGKPPKRLSSRAAGKSGRPGKSPHRSR